MRSTVWRLDELDCRRPPAPWWSPTTPIPPVQRRNVHRVPKSATKLMLVTYRQILTDFQNIFTSGKRTKFPIKSINSFKNRLMDDHWKDIQSMGI